MADHRQIVEAVAPRLAAVRRALGEFLYGMTLHELAVEIRQARGELGRLFMLVVFGDLIGLPILPPYYSMLALLFNAKRAESWAATPYTNPLTVPVKTFVSRLQEV